MRCGAVRCELCVCVRVCVCSGATAESGRGIGSYKGAGWTVVGHGSKKSTAEMCGQEDPKGGQTALFEGGGQSVGRLAVAVGVLTGPGAWFLSLFFGLGLGPGATIWGQASHDHGSQTLSLSLCPSPSHTHSLCLGPEGWADGGWRAGNQRPLPAATVIVIKQSQTGLSVCGGACEEGASW